MVRKTTVPRRSTGGCREVADMGEVNLVDNIHTNTWMDVDTDSSCESDSETGEDEDPELVALASTAFTDMKAQLSIQKSSASLARELPEGEASHVGCSDVQSTVTMTDNAADSSSATVSATEGTANVHTRKPHLNSNNRSHLSSSLQPDYKIGGLYVNVNASKKPKLRNNNIESLLLKTSNNDELMKKSVLTPGFEKKHSILPYEESLNQVRKQRRKEKSLTTGSGWFDMKAPEMTEEKKNDLTILKMRKTLDPKQFYKSADIKALPKFFQMGRVKESAADFYHSRIPKKQRKANLVDELLADAKFRQYNKKKYVELQQSKAKAKGAYKHMKRLKKRK